MAIISPETINELRERATERALDSVRELFASKGVEFDPEHAQQILDGKPSSVPSFPILMFSLGLLKDVFDFLDLTGVGIIVAFVFSIIFFFVFFIWSLGKISGGWWKKKMIAWLWKRAAAAALFEFFPFVQMVPATTLLILLAHYHETKTAKLISMALEQVHAAGHGPRAHVPQFTHAPMQHEDAQESAAT